MNITFKGEKKVLSASFVGDSTFTTINPDANIEEVITAFSAMAEHLFLEPAIPNDAIISAFTYAIDLHKKSNTNGN